MVVSSAHRSDPDGTAADAQVFRRARSILVADLVPRFISRQVSCAAPAHTHCSATAPARDDDNKFLIPVKDNFIEISLSLLSDACIAY